MVSELAKSIDTYGITIVALALIFAFAIISFLNSNKQNSRLTKAMEESSVKQTQVFEETAKRQTEVLHEVANSNMKVADTLGVIKELLADKFGYLEGKITANHSEEVTLLRHHVEDVKRLENVMSNVQNGMGKLDERTKACADRANRFRKED